MDRNELDRFFEDLLAEPEGDDDSVSASARASLASVLLRDDSPAAAENALTAAKLAAYLDGALDAAETKNFLAECGEIYEVEAARSFLGRVSAENPPVPAELVAAVMADDARDMRNPGIAARRITSSHWGWAVGALAASLAAILVGARIADQPAAPAGPHGQPSAAESTQARGKSVIAIPAPAPASPPVQPRKSPQTVYTTPNPPMALTSHAVTVDDYPPASVRLQEQGSVKVQYTIGTDGIVSACTVTLSSGFSRLDEAACVLVQKWTFKPATVMGGGPVAFTVPAEIVFALK